MLEKLLHKFYAASISVDLDGAMLVASTKDRLMVWGMTFCIIAASSLIVFLVWRNKHTRKLSLAVFFLSLTIPVFIMPSVKHEYIYVSPARIIVDTGTWFVNSETIFHFEDLAHIKERENSLIPGNLIGDPSVSWHISWRNGRSEILDLNDFFNAHRMVVAHYIKDRGYIVERLEEQTLHTF